MFRVTSPMAGTVFTPPPAHRATSSTVSTIQSRRPLNRSSFKKLEKVEGLTIAPGTPEDLDRYVQSEANRWRELIKAENIQVQ